MKINVDVKELYERCRKNITAERLKNISSDVIEKYRQRNFHGLSWYASLMGLSPGNDSMSRIFARIIQTYHPDKLKKIQNDLELHYHAENADALVYFIQIYLFDPDDRPRGRPVEMPVEEYSYGEKDFGYGEGDLHDDLNDYRTDDEMDYEEEVREYGFIEAANDAFFGNLDITVEAGDLKNLQGEIDLSGCDIVDLRGMEYCVNLAGINLSGNRIERLGPLGKLTFLEKLYLAENEIDSIEPLRGLSELRELDISFNMISDISPLLDCRELVYLNALSNPLEDVSVISELQKRGVIVIV